MKTSRLAQSVTSNSLIIVREFAMMQGISEPYSRSSAASLMRKNQELGQSTPIFLPLTVCINFAIKKLLRAQWVAVVGPAAIIAASLPA